MSPSASLRSAGFAALLAVSGESLTYNVGNSSIADVQAVINRRPAKLRTVIQGAANIDFTLMAMCEVEILFTGISVQPQTGGSFLDSLGNRHRIVQVTASDITWICTCKSSQV